MFLQVNSRKILGIILFLELFFILPPQSITTSEGQKEEKINPLTISAIYPNLNFSTYFGGSDGDNERRIAVASDGSSYISGFTKSSNFPTQNAYDNTFNGGVRDAIVAKFSPEGLLLWSTFLGGSNDDLADYIGLATDGSCYITGYTTSSDFPTKNAYDSTHNGGDIGYDVFVTKFATNGTLLWSTFLGGEWDDYGHAINVASDGSCYVTGETYSNSFPIQNAYDSTYNGGDDAFITKFSASGALLWSTYFGGEYFDYGISIAIKDDKSCYITGITRSSNFPTQNGYDSTYNGGGDAFVTKFAPNGSLLWSTYLGGNDFDEGIGIATASDGSCFITGYTYSNNFPTLNAYDSTYGGNMDAFIAKFSTTGSLLWSTYLGGNSQDVGFALAGTNNDNCYIIGYTSSSNFPTINAFDSTSNGLSDVFITKFSSSGSLFWSTYLGGSNTDYGYGIAVAADGNFYVAGDTNSNNFPILNAYDSTYNGDYDAFLTKFIETTSPPPTTNGQFQIPVEILYSLIPIALIIIVGVFLGYWYYNKQKIKPRPETKKELEIKATTTKEAMDSRIPKGEVFFCQSCGYENSPDNIFCANCGTRLKK